MCFAPQRRPLFRHLNFQKSSEHWCALKILTSKCASRDNGMHFFDIATSKSAPRTVCFARFDFKNVLRATTGYTFSTSQLPKVFRNVWSFYHFDLPMCFAPQQRALIMLRATTACTFSTSHLPKVFRTCGHFTILTCQCASRRNGVHFFDISTSKSRPNMCALKILTSKCASRHDGVHFFDIATSKSAPELRCFAHFDFKICFAPQRRTLFPHLNFQKCPETDMLCHFFFLLPNVLR